MHTHTHFLTRRVLGTFSASHDDEVTLITRPEADASVANGFHTIQLQSFVDPDAREWAGAALAAAAADGGGMHACTSGRLCCSPASHPPAGRG